MHTIRSSFRKPHRARLATTAIVAGLWSLVMLDAVDRRACPDRRQTDTPVTPDRHHGERRAYQLGCRCSPCRSANAAYQATFRQARCAGRPLLGAHVPAARTHKLMLVLRIEQLTNGDVARLLGWHGNYGRIYHAATVSLRTHLRVQRLYRERCLTVASV
jgi:hypothetical protein